MSLEGQDIDRKSLRTITGKTADWSELAKDCVAFANAQGGRLLGRHRGWKDRGTHRAKSFCRTYRKGAHQVRSQIKSLANEGVLLYAGDRRWRRYWLV